MRFTFPIFVILLLVVNAQADTNEGAFSASSPVPNSAEIALKIPIQRATGF